MKIFSAELDVDKEKFDLVVKIDLVEVVVVSTIVEILSPSMSIVKWALI